MEKLSLKLIRKNNVRKVLSVISQNRHISKLEISKETGLSLMTVGKIVSFLGAAGIITHSKNISQHAGRRPEILRVRTDWLIPVFEIASRIFKFYITDLEGKVIDRVEYRCCDDPRFVANEFISFLYTTLDLLKHKYKHKKSIGLGISVSGVYDAEQDKIISSMMPELSSIKLMQNISKIFKQKNIVIDNASRLCAMGIIESQNDFKERTITFVSVGESIEASTCDKGVYIRGSQGLAGRLGDLPFPLKVTYANYIRDSEGLTEIFEPLLELLKIACVAYDPDTIYICSDKFIFSPAFKDRIQSSLKHSMPWYKGSPEIHAINSQTLESLGGIINRVLDNWLDRILDKDE